MPAGLHAAMILIAQAASGGVATPVAPTPAARVATVAPADEGCAPRRPENDRQIVICAPKPQGYRIDPDILEARREAKNHTRPKPPNKMKDNSCVVVGPAPCMDAPMVNLLAAAATAAKMAVRLSKGQEIGSMFVTDPQPTEYQLYKEARARREAEAAEKAAKAKAKAAAEAKAEGPARQ